MSNSSQAQLTGAITSVKSPPDVGDIQKAMKRQKTTMLSSLKNVNQSKTDDNNPDDDNSLDDLSATEKKGELNRKKKFDLYNGQIYINCMSIYSSQ